MEDFRTVYITAETSSPIEGAVPFFGFAIEDYLECCLRANVYVPSTAKVFGFCLTEKEIGMANQSIIAPSLVGLLRGIDIQNISILVIDFSYFQENIRNLSRDAIKNYLDLSLIKFGFEEIAPFDATYSNRLVYIGDTDDGFLLKRWLRKKNDKVIDNE